MESHVVANWMVTYYKIYSSEIGCKIGSNFLANKKVERL
jgi:hypothetical protein